MKFIKISFIVAIAVAACFGLASTSFAFHGGGVAACESCHTMHNSLDNTAMGVNGRTTNVAYLLKGSDQSSTCLNCHGKGSTLSGYHISTENIVGAPATGNGELPQQLTPGGDFSWIKVKYGTKTSATAAGAGDRRGHNIVAADFSFNADTKKVGNVAPGGSYPVSELHCSSCHDPHGRYRRTSDTDETFETTGGAIEDSGSYDESPAPSGGYAVGAYRLLAGIGYKPASLSAPITFGAESPVAVVPKSYNRSEAASETHVAYGSGMSEWCGNCHGSFVENNFVSGVDGHTHPAGNAATMGGGTNGIIYQNYNAYVKTGDMSGGDQYMSLVPFEVGTASDFGTLKSQATTTDAIGKAIDATATSNVMCLSCHRAHASGFDSMLRFPIVEHMTDLDVDGTTVIYYGRTDGAEHGMTNAQVQKALYDRPASNFGAFQRSLCNKCHAKD